MGFLTAVNERITINNCTYLLGEHPHAPGIPYGQEGRQGTVYLLYPEKKSLRKQALKVFRPKFANPSMVLETEQLLKYSNMTGLSVCDRCMITPQNNAELLKRQPDLLYAVLMPWIEGPTWMEVLLNKQRLTKRQSYKAAFALIEILVMMEQRGLAHCDLSAPNIMIPVFSKEQDVKSTDYIQLIDLEQLYAPQIQSPEVIPAGSPGYAPRHKDRLNMWGIHSDRFSGAVLLMEMLGACTERFTANVWGESFFDPKEIQTNCDRFDVLIEVVRTIWGDELVSLFMRAWNSSDFQQCPSFGEWLMAMSKIEPANLKEIETEIPAGDAQPAVSQSRSGKIEQILNQAREFERMGNDQEAIRTYRSIYLLNPHTSLTKEVDIAIETLEESLKSGLQEQAAGLGLARLSFWKPLLLIILFVAAGFVGFITYPLVFDTPSIEADEMIMKISENEALNEQLSKSKLSNEQLVAQLQELKKPQAQRREDLIHTLNSNYYEIQVVASSNPGFITDIEGKTYEASKAYMEYVLEYFRSSHDLDPQFIDQFHIVGGYYYPYLYNRNRNTQLNLQFFNDYKENF